LTMPGLKHASPPEPEPYVAGATRRRVSAVIRLDTVWQAIRTLDP
jgi:hypothetical protein